MSESSSDLPLRRRPIRKAKEKAALQIKKYFKPRSLQAIPEDIVFIQKPAKVIKDKNNNPKTKPKQNSKQSAQRSKSDKKESINGVNLENTKQSVNRNGLKQTKNQSNGSKVSSSPEVILSSRVISKDLIILDSSISSNESTYDFDALQTDDPTDEEIDVELTDTKKPYWSLYKNRIAIVIDQTDVKTKVVDKLFGSGPETIISTEIFPSIAPIRRRRSTAVWNTPLRYSVLPKY